jgi:hypothetical protein
LSPQHSTVPLGRIPQVWYPAALTCANAPDGGEDWPSPLAPQHSTVPSGRIPQVWCPPRLLAKTRRAGLPRLWRPRPLPRRLRRVRPRLPCVTSSPFSFRCVPLAFLLLPSRLALQRGTNPAAQAAARLRPALGSPVGAWPGCAPPTWAAALATLSVPSPTRAGPFRLSVRMRLRDHALRLMLPTRSTRHSPRWQWVANCPSAQVRSEETGTAGRRANARLLWRVAPKVR